MELMKKTENEKNRMKKIKKISINPNSEII